MNETNVKMLVRELLNFLLISDIEFKPDLTAKLCLVRPRSPPPSHVALCAYAP